LIESVVHFYRRLDTQHVSATICAEDQDYEFVITLANEVIRLAAPSWEAMQDWVECLQGKLLELKILTPKENLYSKLPEIKGPLLPTRDPTSPLPPPPAVPPALLPGIEPIQAGRSPQVTRRRPLLRGQSLPGDTTIDANNDNFTIVQVPNVFTFDINNVRAQETENNSYERLFESSEASGPSNTSLRNNAANPSAEICLTLRGHQVMELQKEMEHPAGVRVVLRKKDLYCIALIDAYESVWISGWKQKENPTLQNVIHIGDQLISVEGRVVKNASNINKFLRSCNKFNVEVIIKRVPYGQVFIIHRDVEGQTLGISQENNTAVIANVDPDGLAARHGLSLRAQTVDGLSLTNWVLTEINGRPLNLFYKENEIKDRLNCVGRDISILVQPLDLVKLLKKQLKSMKNYKDYLLQ